MQSPNSPTRCACAIAMAVIFILGMDSVKAALRDKLELFFPLTEQDSVVTLRQIAPDRLVAVIVNQGTGETRELEQPVQETALPRLLEEARTEGVTVEIALRDEPAPTVLPAEPDDPVPAQLTGAGGARSASAQRKNRLEYIVSQTFFSTYAYGIALPLAFESPDNIGAMTLLALPASFGAHYWYAKDRTWEDAHVSGTGYFAGASVYAAYVLPPLLLGASDNAFRIGNFLLLGAYPASIYYGYRHGERYIDNPGRISMQSTSAVVGGVFGFFLTGSLWGEIIDDGEFGVRLMMAQMTGGALAGHFFSNNYRPDNRLAQGIGPGIFTHSVLGFLLGVNALILSDGDFESPTVPFGMLTAGLAAGYAEGLWYFHDRHDNVERAVYNALGAVGGAAFSGGLMTLSGSEGSPKVFTSLLVGSAIAGYLITDLFTKELVETRGHRDDRRGDTSPRFSWDVTPIPHLMQAGEKVTWGVRIPGLTVRFN